MMSRFTALYGERPLHLVVLLSSFALAGYALLLWLGDPALLRMGIWFVGAALAHDLLLFPLYAAADRVLGLVAGRLPKLPVPIVNYIRVPALGAGLTFLMFLPGIIRQGGGTFTAATGLDQQPYLGRWLLLVATLFTVSGAVYTLRAIAVAGSPDRQQQVVDGDRQHRLRHQPEPSPRQQRARDDQPDRERQPDPLHLGLAQAGHVGEQDRGQRGGGE
jgi:hypothetical protein